MNGAKVGICCEVGKVTSELTVSGRRTIGSAKRWGRSKVGSLETSKDRLGVNGGTGRPEENRDDKGGRGIDSSEVIGSGEW